ncbi:ABC transporter substrate-binding protein [Chondromyces apiculatus]|uniref:ABC transporter substrate-binding protein n=1 Tax=Chondromyces apiculatus TaxID=51 RepID=UPI001E2CB53D|nr:ABC transporter substrate-binding protein [Chondromyces apiculatus]
MAPSLRTFGRMLGVAAVALGLVLGGSGCSLIVENGTEQCENNGDCAAFEGAICSSEKICVSLAELGCASNSDCVNRYGADYVCAPAGGDARACKSLVLNETQCRPLAGTPATNDAIIIGSIGPISGDDSGIGIPIENAALVAVNDFREAAAPGARPMVLVGCDDASDSNVALASTDHLLSVGSPAIIGAAFSGITLDIATRTVEAGTLLISPSATAVALSNLVDQTLVWRTAPPDTYQAQAIARYVEGDLATWVDQTPLRVAILHHSDAYGKDLGIALEGELLLNGYRPTQPQNAGNYVRIDYGASDDTSDRSAVINEIRALNPHIVVMAGYSEAVDYLFGPLENAYEDAGTPHTSRPFYVMTDGVVGDRLSESIGNLDPLRKRVSGTTPGRARSNPVFQAFTTRYKDAGYSATDAELFGSAEAYDALYVLAYSAATIPAETPVTGLRLSQGFPRLIPPENNTPFTPVNAGIAAIPDTVARLGNGEQIDLTGASGPLDFNGSGDVAADIQIWCLRREANGNTGSTVLSGLYLDAADPSALKGDLIAACEPLAPAAP